MFNGFVLVSLVLCLAASTMWVSSYRLPKTWLITSRPDRAMFASSKNGELRFWEQKILQPVPLGLVVKLQTPDVGVVTSADGSSAVTNYWMTGPLIAEQYGMSSDVRPGAFSINGQHSQFVLLRRQLLLPWWPLPFVSALPIVFAIAMWAVRRRRTKVGHCAACYYNLTGNVSGVCPECGKPIASKA